MNDTGEHSGRNADLVLSLLDIANLTSYYAPLPSLPHATDYFYSTRLLLVPSSRSPDSCNRRSYLGTMRVPINSDGEAHDNGRPRQAVLGRSFRHARMENQ